MTKDSLTRCSILESAKCFPVVIIAFDMELKRKKKKVNSRCFKLNRFFSVSVKSCRVFGEMNAKGLHLSSGKKKKRGNYCLVFTSYIKYGIRECHNFRRAKTAKKWAKKGLLLVQSCCFTSLNLLEVLPFSLRSPWSLLNLLPLGRRLT